MKKLLIFSLLFTSLFLFGCGSDDDDGDDNGTNPPPALQVTAATAASAPTTVDDAVWGTITAKTVPTTSINFGKLTPTSPAAVANSVSVKAAVHSDRLYMRFEWTDATESVWRESYRVTGRDALSNHAILYHELSSHEDILMVMFEDTAQTLWDVWQWRALTTDGAGLAEGASISGSTYTPDATSLAGGTDVATVNEDGLQPMYIHNTLDQFTGHLLIEDETVVFVPATHLPLGGWTVGQHIPGHVIDPDVAQDSQRGSKWDITAASDYTGGVWSVVLSCDLNTSSADDLDMSSLSQVNMRVAITNNMAFSYSTGSTNQGFSASVPLILP